MSKEKKKTLSYKYCFVPFCKSTTIATPNKTFICVPKSEETRRIWSIAAAYGGNLRFSSSICEDHFKLDEDLENYMEWKMTGCRKRLKEGIYPRYFSCQATSKFASALVPPNHPPTSTGIKEDGDIKEEDPLAIEKEPDIKEETGPPSFQLVEPFDFIDGKAEARDLEDNNDNVRARAPSQCTSLNND